MTEETWEIIGKGSNTIASKCVRYLLRYAWLRVAQSNVRKEFFVLLKKVITQETIQKLSPKKDTQETEVPLYFVTMLSGSKAKIRLVLGTDELAHSNVALIKCECEKTDGWENFSISNYNYDEWFIDTEAISLSLDTERMVFIDTEGKATREPILEIAEEGEKIIITAPIKGITNAEFDQAFAKKKKERKVAAS